MQTEQVTVVVNGPDVDMASAPTLRRDLLATLDGSTQPDIVVDLSQVQFIDSTGVGALIEIRESILQRGGSIALARLTDQPRRTLTLLGLLGDGAFTVSE